jgi:hypothetical protein
MPQHDVDAADAWQHEIFRRIASIDAGTATLIDRDELTRRMTERMRKA